MEVLRAEIEAITASFRYPMFVVSHQPTYKVPPISTIYGLLSAAKGAKVSIYDFCIGYDFTYQGTGVDLERLSIIGRNSNGSLKYSGTNIVHREFLYGCKLTLYLSDLSFRKYLEKPIYAPLLGRQSDLAIIKSIEQVKLVKKEEVSINNTIIPFDGNISGQVVSLPSDYTDEAERKPVEVKTYCIIESKQHIKNGYYDSDLDKGVYLHEFTNKSKK